MRLITIAIAIYLLYSCSQTEKELPVCSLIKGNKENSLLSSNLVDSIYFFPIETNDSIILGDQYQIKIDNDLIAINDYLSTKQLCTFTYEGNFMNKIGHHGNGPGELTHFHDFILREKNIEISDFNVRKSIKYDSKGEIIDVETLPHHPMYFEADSTEHYWFYNGWNNPHSNFTLIKTDASYSTIGSYFPIQSNAIPFDINPFSKVGDQLFYHEPFSDKLYRVVGGELKAVVQIKSEKKLPDAFHHGDSFSTFEKMDRDGFYLVNKCFENNYFIYINYKYQKREFVQNSHILFNKHSGITYYFHINDDHPEFNLNFAHSITEKNELIFIVNSYIFNNLNISNRNIHFLDNPVILYLKLHT
jgi:hypothetical protein